MNDNALPRILDTAAEQLRARNHAGAWQTLLDTAQHHPLDDRLHRLLECARPDLRIPDLGSALPRTMSQIARHFHGLRPAEVMRSLLPLLLERHVFDERLLDLPIRPEGTVLERWTRVGPHDELAAHIPAHWPVHREPDHWSEPKVRLPDNLLLKVSQSAEREQRGALCRQDESMFVAYRIRGPLFHARFVRVEWWWNGHEPWVGSEW